MHHFLTQTESSETHWELCGVGRPRQAKASLLTAAFPLSSPRRLRAALPPPLLSSPQPSPRQLPLSAAPSGLLGDSLSRRRTYSPAAPERRAARSRRRTSGRCRSPRSPWRLAAPRASGERRESEELPSAPDSAGAAMHAARSGRERLMISGGPRSALPPGAQRPDSQRAARGDGCLYGRCKAFPKGFPG